MTTNLGKWSSWYDTATEQLPYAGLDGQLTYRLASKWLTGLPVEDWGCGYGWFKNVHDAPVHGIDGTDSHWCDEVADLVEYRSTTPGLLLRHVLEHELRWERVLDNAVASFEKRMVIVLFTPLVDETTVIAENVGGLGVPDIAFRLEDVTGRLTDCEFTARTVESPATAYGCETVIQAER